MSKHRLLPTIGEIQIQYKTFFHKNITVAEREVIGSVINKLRYADQMYSTQANACVNLDNTQKVFANDLLLWFLDADISNFAEVLALYGMTLDTQLYCSNL